MQTESSSKIAWFGTGILLLLLLSIVVILIVARKTHNEGTHIHFKTDALKVKGPTKQDSLDLLWADTSPMNPANLVQGGARTTTNRKAFFTGRGYTTERGIVFTCKTPEDAPKILRTIEQLKRHQSALPIECWYVDSTKSTVSILPDYVQCVLLEATVPYLLTRPETYHIVGMFMSSFDHVLHIAPGIDVLSSPDSLFDRPQYVKHGSMFWKDVQPLDKTAKCFKSVRSNAYFQQTQQVMVVDRQKHWSRLWTILRIMDNNLASLFPKTGKDIVHLTWSATKQHAHFVEHRPVLLSDRDMRGVGLGFKDEKGQLLFIQNRDETPGQRTYISTFREPRSGKFKDWTYMGSVQTENKEAWLANL